MRTIANLRDLCRYLFADTPAQLNRRIYKATSCGASISLYLPEGEPIHNGDRRWATLDLDTPIIGFTIQTIVEGSEATVDSDVFLVPVAGKSVDSWIAEMEAEADRLWREANDGDAPE